MKKIFITFIFLYLSINNCFSSLEINLSTDKQNYNIDENIILDIDILWNTDQGWEILVDWLSNFNIVSKRQSQNISIINSKKNISQKFSFYLQALKSGEYTIWPAYLRDSEIKSEILKIKVSGDSIMLRKNTDNINSWNLQDEEQNLDDVDLWLKKKDITSRTIFWIDWEEMKDIYWLKWNMYWKIVSKESIYFLFISLLALLLYLLYQKILNKYLYTQKSLEIKTPKKPVNYLSMINYFEKKYLESKKEIFYSKLSQIFREYLDEKIENWLSNKSFSELKENKKIKKDLLNIYEKIYFPEYNNLSDSIEERTKILTQLKQKLK